VSKYYCQRIHCPSHSVTWYSEIWILISPFGVLWPSGKGNGTILRNVKAVVVPWRSSLLFCQSLGCGDSPTGWAHLSDTRLSLVQEPASHLLCTNILLLTVTFHLVTFTIAECTFIILEKSAFENTGDEIGKLYISICHNCFCIIIVATPALTQYFYLQVL
jgi:hypothetical protein